MSSTYARRLLFNSPNVSKMSPGNFSATILQLIRTGRQGQR